mmetsp:Transcript_5293/g.19059  ORF Transcript_5293/g.19059 Transcript_5293/m.19059 type:complete len:350 (+) Transcript_5293:4298-5347(+)
MTPYMYPRHVSTSFHCGSGSQRFGVRSRHVSIVSWISVRAWPGFGCCGRLALASSTKMRVDSCSSTMAWNECRTGTCALAPVSGSFHHRSRSSLTACLQYCSASLTRPLSSALYTRTMLISAVSSTSDVAADAGRRSRTVFQSFIRHALCSCSSVCSTAREKSEMSSHWFSCFALFSQFVSHRHSSVFVTPETCPALARCIPRKKTSCASCQCPCCVNASPARVMSDVHRCRHRPTRTSCSPRRRYSSASASKHRASCGYRTTWFSRSAIAMCHALYVFPRYLMSSLGIFGCGCDNDMPSRRAWTTFGRTAACLWWYSLESSAIIGLASVICSSRWSVAHTMGNTRTQR